MPRIALREHVGYERPLDGYSGYPGMKLIDNSLDG